jgi:hypothetical protein
MTTNLVGGFNPSEKYESQLGSLVPIYMEKIKNVPNHQSVISLMNNIIRSTDDYRFTRLVLIRFTIIINQTVMVNNGL